MPVVSFPAQKLLAFPAGRMAGFDPNHVAARNCGFSGVASYGGAFGHVLSRVKGTESGTKTTSLHGSLGPVTNYLNDGATTTDSTIFPFVSSTSNLTLAGIFKVTAIPPTTGYIINTAAAGANGIGDVGGTGNFWIVGGVANTDTLVTYAVGVPYFFALSFSGTVFNWIIVRLDSGQVRQGSAADTIAAGDGTITVGSRGNVSPRQINGGIAAAMAANASMSPQQLLQWAQDPWAFWYPRQMEMLVAASGVTTYAAFCIPQDAGRSNARMVGY